MQNLRVLSVFLAVVGLSACGGESAINSQVRTKAASDFNCHQSAIEFVEDRPLEKRVRGCGQELIYARTCSGSGSRGWHGSAGGDYTGSCQWVARIPEEESNDVTSPPPVEQTFEGETTVETEKTSE